MNVTRDVIYDLLPGYFSGDISPDTRALVDEFLRQDPEFARMMDRVRGAYGDRRPAASASFAGDREAFERARDWLHQRSELRGYVVAFGLAAFLLLIFILIRLSGPINPAPVFIAIGLTAVAATAAVRLFKLTDRGPERRVR